jgi:hypothetical protein
MPYTQCESPQLLNFYFDADPDPDPVFEFDADPGQAFTDPDPDPSAQNNSDPDPQHWLQLRALWQDNQGIKQFSWLRRTIQALLFVENAPMFPSLCCCFFVVDVL